MVAFGFIVKTMSPFSLAAVLWMLDTVSGPEELAFTVTSRNTAPSQYSG